MLRHYKSRNSQKGYPQDREEIQLDNQIESRPRRTRCPECKRYECRGCLPLSELDATVPTAQPTESNPSWTKPQPSTVDRDSEIARRLAQIQRERRAEEW